MSPRTSHNIAVMLLTVVSSHQIQRRIVCVCLRTSVTFAKCCKNPLIRGSSH